MRLYCPIRIITFLVASCIALNAQASREADPVPLKNCATPLYWQPNQTEREASRQSAAQIQFSPNATSTTALIFVAVSPCRLVDTRGASAGFTGSTPFNGPYIPAGGTVTFPVQSATETATTAPTPCGTIPSIAQSYSVNLTLVPHPLGTPVNYVTMWPDNGSAIPSVSTLNDQQGAVVANSAIVPAGTNSGGIKVFAYGATDVIIDMNGFYAAPSDLNGNTAVGSATLTSNTTGADNTAIGVGALVSNNVGKDNTADGFNALYFNTTGAYNTATGYAALGLNISGYYNTANGYQALFSNSQGSYNTASGSQAMLYNTTGGQNTAVGFYALHSNTSGSDNTVIGDAALYDNTTGSTNTAVGSGALIANTTGSNNIAIGYNSAMNVNGGSNNNIHIGNPGSSTDDGVIFLGTEGVQSNTFIAGIYGSIGAGGTAVYVNSLGKVSITASSRRFKEQITDMGDTSSKLFQLRPVNFYYKPEFDDGSHLLQYGLIAEEVEKIYPEMVDYDKDGQVHAVKYQLLTPMLLNEVQKQNRELEAQVQLQKEENYKLEEANRALEDRLTAVEKLLSSQTSTVARSSSSQ